MFKHLQYNPVYKAYETLCFHWVDQMCAESIKLYYWPFFVAGNLDNWKEILTCQIRPKK